jgi:hypothetical protein
MTAAGRTPNRRLMATGVGTSFHDGANLGAEAVPDVVEPRLAATHAFTNPGTYFPTLRVASQRERNPSTPFARSLNLSRVRVVVVDE